MIKKIKKHLLIISTSVMFFAPVGGSTLVASAVAPTGCDAVSGAVANGAANSLPANGGANSIDCQSTNVATSDITDLARRIVTAFSLVVGAASVIMIIYGGFRYIISGGESSRVGAAKTSLIYAIVGLVIVALAQLIIHFVLNQTNQVGS